MLCSAPHVITADYNSCDNYKSTSTRLLRHPHVAAGGEWWDRCRQCGDQRVRGQRRRGDLGRQGWNEKWAAHAALCRCILCCLWRSVSLVIAGSCCARWVEAGRRQLGRRGAADFSLTFPVLRCQKFCCWPLRGSWTIFVAPASNAG